MITPAEWRAKMEIRLSDADWRASVRDARPETPEDHQPVTIVECDLCGEEWPCEGSSPVTAT